MSEAILLLGSLAQMGAVLAAASAAAFSGFQARKSLTAKRKFTEIVKHDQLVTLEFRKFLSDGDLNDSEVRALSRAFDKALKRLEEQNELGGDVSASDLRIFVKAGLSSKDHRLLKEVAYAARESELAAH
jgi:hypothetical protein